MQLQVDVDGKGAKRKLEAARRAVKDYREPLKQIKTYELNEIRKNFVTRGTNITGKRWAKRKKSYSHNILEKTGKLKGSFRSTKLTKTELHIDSRVDYYKYHQLGTSKMPKRQITGFSEKMKKQILNIIHKYLTKKIRFG